MSRILNVALTTDTILYAPFFLAYIGGDTEETPFGPVSVRIIGQQDYRFQDPNRRLRGDAFVCYSLLLGLADVGIGDPSVLVDLYNYPQESVGGLQDFVEQLDQDTRISLTRKYPVLTTGRAEDLVKLCHEQRLRVVGGLVSKFAFQVVGDPSLIVEGTPKGRPHNVGAVHCGHQAKDAARGISEIICYDSPSTGYCFGRLLSGAAARLTGNKAPAIKEREFGEELLCVSGGTVAITCDFVATNLRSGGGRPWFPVSAPIRVLDDYVDHPDGASGPRNMMFTGVMARVDDTAAERSDLMRGLLYAIDKNLYEINEYLTSGDKFGLLAYFEEKLKTNDVEKSARARSFLLADKDITKSLEGRRDVRVREIVEFFISSLFEWKKTGTASLFYSEIQPEEKDLEEICRVRVAALGRVKITPGLSTSMCLDLLNEKSVALGGARWYSVERRLPKLRGKQAWRYMRHANSLFTFTQLVALMTILGVLLAFFGLGFPLGKHLSWLNQETDLHRASLMVFLGAILLVVILTSRWSRSAFLLTYERFVYRRDPRRPRHGVRKLWDELVHNKWSEAKRRFEPPASAKGRAL